MHGLLMPQRVCGDIVALRPRATKPELLTMRNGHGFQEHRAAARHTSFVSHVCGLVVAVALPWPAMAANVTVTPDDSRTLVSKDVGGERWAISYNSREDGTVTGNVFFTDGGSPRFIWCEESAESSGAELMLRCSGADRCTAAPCEREDWTRLGEFPIAKSFFQPDQGLTWTRLDNEVGLPSSFFEPPAPGDESRESGIQVTPDGQRLLINKDIGGDRWAITRNLTDGTVTGNFFETETRSPEFLWCVDVTPDAAAPDRRFQCSIAEPVGCGDGVRENGEDCDGLDDQLCPGACDDTCKCMQKTCLEGFADCLDDRDCCSGLHCRLSWYGGRRLCRGVEDLGIAGDPCSNSDDCISSLVCESRHGSYCCARSGERCSTVQQLETCCNGCDFSLNTAPFIGGCR